MYKQKSFYYGLLIAVLGIFLVAASVFSWTEPSTAPPTNPPTFSPPLNTGSAVETKSGGLNILGRIGAGTASVDTNYRITTSGGGIKAESTNQPAGYFNSATGYGLLVNTGNVGIGILTPGAKLEVAGQIKITGGSPGAGKVLTSDANGLATWGTVSGTLPSGVSGQTLRHNGTNWVANSVIFNNGTDVGIGTTNPGAKLDVAGDIRTTGQLYGNGAASSYGTLSVNGTKGAYSGINFRNGTANFGTLMFYYDGSANQYTGVYNAADNGWSWYWTNGALTQGTIPWARIPGGVEIFQKSGNNGTVSGDTFCQGSQWGTTGSCLGQKRVSDGAYFACSDVVGTTVVDICVRIP